MLFYLTLDLQQVKKISIVNQRVTFLKFCCFSKKKVQDGGTKISAN